MKFWTPEILAPAGNLEKLKVAVLYGAHAVYLGGQKFGLRAASENFTFEEMLEGVEFAHSRGSKVYVVLNGFLHDKDLEELVPFLEQLEFAQVDAVIVSDLGVVETVRNHSKLEIHLSTQSSCLNIESALFWKEKGVKRVVLGREVSIKEAKAIKEATGLEIEMFIHGSMCMAYSGNCVISNYTQGRDSNRGGCAHSCRFEYSLDFADQDQWRAFFMSSKDLEGIRVLNEFIDAGIDSLKIEGRMKSAHYAGTVSKVYSEAIKYYQKHGHLLGEQLLKWEKELAKLPHRDYTTASLIEKAGADSIYNEREHDDNDWSICAIVVDVLSGENAGLVVEVRSKFLLGDQLELVPFEGDSIEFKLDQIVSLSGVALSETRPSTLVRIPCLKSAQKFNIIRRSDVQRIEI